MGLDVYFFKERKNVVPAGVQARNLSNALFKYDEFDPEQRDRLLADMREGVELLRKAKFEPLTDSVIEAVNGFEERLNSFLDKCLDPKAPENKNEAWQIRFVVGTLARLLSQFWQKKANYKEVAYFRKVWEIPDFFGAENCVEKRLSKEDIESIRDHEQSRLEHRDYCSHDEEEIIELIVREMKKVLRSVDFEKYDVSLYCWW